MVGFENPSHYGDLLIKPSRKVYEDLIIQEWPNMQRIMVSLAQKDVTQATIVRKLSSHLRQNQTQNGPVGAGQHLSYAVCTGFIDDVVTASIWVTGFQYLRRMTGDSLFCHTNRTEPDFHGQSTPSIKDRPALSWFNRRQHEVSICDEAIEIAQSYSASR